MKYRVSEKLMKIPLEDEDGNLCHSIPFSLTRDLYEKNIDFIREYDSRVDSYIEQKGALKSFFVELPYNIELDLSNSEYDNLYKVDYINTEDASLKQLNTYPFLVNKSHFDEIINLEDE